MKKKKKQTIFLNTDKETLTYKNDNGERISGDGQFGDSKFFVAHNFYFLYLEFDFDNMFCLKEGILNKNEEEFDQ